MAFFHRGHARHRSTLHGLPDFGGYVSFALVVRLATRTDFPTSQAIDGDNVSQVDMSTYQISRHGFLLGIVFCLTMIGCDRPQPIITYRVSTKIPEPFQIGKDRMLAAMVPSGDQVWFFKVTGPESAVTSIEASFRQFVEGIKITAGSPELSELPKGWRKGADKQMRFASIDVDTPGKQLDISISKLGRQEDYDDMVAMNVNRWRGQLALSPSKEKWASADSINVPAADGPSVWVDLVGTGGGGAPSMSPPFAGGAPMSQPPMSQPPMMAPPTPPTENASATPAEPDPRLKFDRPDGWRDGRMSTMRMAAFDVGPADAPAEMTVIPAGGDLRGNVARWLGQVRDGNAPDDVVDKALKDAIKVDVDGRSGQRFYLASEDAEKGTAIDATIVPLEGGMSLFVKMTGPAKTVSAESDSIESFLKSLKLNL